MRQAATASPAIAAIVDGSSATARPTIFSDMRAAIASAAAPTRASIASASGAARGQQADQRRRALGAPLLEPSAARLLERRRGPRARLEPDRLRLGAGVHDDGRYDVTLDDAAHLSGPLETGGVGRRRAGEQGVSDGGRQALRDGREGGLPLGRERPRDGALSPDGAHGAARGLGRRGRRRRATRASARASSGRERP